MSQTTLLLIVKMIDTLALAVQMQPQVRQTYDRLSAKLQEMVREGRDPTPTEWATLDAETDALSAAIQAAHRGR